MKRVVLIAVVSAALSVASAGAAVVDLLFKPASPDLMNFGSGTWNVRFRPTRDLQLTGLGLIFDPVPSSATPSLFFGLLQDEVVANDDRLAMAAPVLGNDFQDTVGRVL
jgi:hypothetical protein